MFKTAALNSVADAYVDKDIPSATPGTRIEAADRNIIQDEMVAMVESSGQTINTSGTFTTQCDIACAIYGGGAGEFYEDSGAADAYVLGRPNTEAETVAYFDGMKISFVPTNTNTGASTVDVSGLGAEDIQAEGGAALPGAYLQSGVRVDAVYDLANTRFEVVRFPFAVKTTIFTSSGAHTPTAGVKTIELLVQGGGGGAGGVDGQGAGTGAASGGGGAGGVTTKISSVIDPTYTITIGAAGAGGTGTGGGNGSAGGATTVSSATLTLQGNGGGAGLGMVGNAGSILTSGGGGTGSSGGDVNLAGNHGTTAGVVGGDISCLGDGAGSSLLGGGPRGIVNGAGTAGLNYGAGGGGTGIQDAATDYNGGAGKAGVVIIKEYF